MSTTFTDGTLYIEKGSWPLQLHKKIHNGTTILWPKTERTFFVTALALSKTPLKTRFLTLDASLQVHCMHTHPYLLMLLVISSTFRLVSTNIIVLLSSSCDISSSSFSNLRQFMISIRTVLLIQLQINMIVFINIPNNDTAMYNFLCITN